MLKDALLFPMATYVLMIWLGCVKLFFTRKQAIKSGTVPARHFKVQSSMDLPEDLAKQTRHYNNQFELPVLFFITCLACMHLGQENLVTVICAWMFVASRGVHSWIFLTRNHIIRRALAFAFGWIMILLMWAYLVITALMLKF